MLVPHYPPMPRFEREHDGNPFDWIVAAARRVRAQRQQIDELSRAIRDSERRTARKDHDGQQQG